jgi:beta-glucosidase/6-phospho-beta-glucosidase/beta-galactosidase
MIHSYGGPANPFQSFWMGGYECTDQLNAFGSRVDLLNTTGHLEYLEQDYQGLADFEIRTVREGIRWSFVEYQPYHYDWSVVETMIRKGQQQGIQQVWDICHFGFPDDLTPLHPMFARRFAHLCKAFVHFYRSLVPSGTLIVTPINEVSFISWLGGEVRGTSPYCVGQGWEVKYRLMKAYIEGIVAMKEVDPTVRILTTEPLVNMVPPVLATIEDLEDAANQNELQFQSLDMLAGRICPELGGNISFIDLVGFNYYYNNQWIINSGNFLPWFNEDNDPRWKPLSTLLEMGYNRYKRPILITETSHSQEHRPNWIEFIGNEVSKVIEAGIPLLGICLYPIIDRPDWDFTDTWHGSGLWDLELENGKGKARKLYQQYATELRRVQKQVDAAMEREKQRRLSNISTSAA